MPFLDPYDSVYKAISMPRWQKDSIKRYSGINFSGLIQEQVIIPMIMVREPNIFAKFVARKVRDEMFSKITQ